jgi:hypothetical protein
MDRSESMMAEFLRISNEIEEAVDRGDVVLTVLSVFHHTSLNTLKPDAKAAAEYIITG